MSDVLISYSVLNELNGSLKQILVELDEASNRSDQLEEAIGTPCGRGELRSRASSFESGWDDRRRYLRDDIAKVQQHVEETGAAWEDWDVEASKSLSVDAGETRDLPRA
ncbi:hypothetical protein ARHIZOSPH14_21800 [Agromyces rhizosphaerae]|uniref:Flagellar protein FlgN n=1 Tax=Agromyces rhizosphaerae TaxID=88374 RepID=A0A9W6D1R3_9MICO|nr:hypothetical protein [Agromyces rhizosphaerae]GLI27938.1 hypothetical protein ARHIZOSPH14_21800 [Agromyces rhizosphaerae]